MRGDYGRRLWEETMGGKYGRRLWEETMGGDSALSVNIFRDSPQL